MPQMVAPGSLAASVLAVVALVATGSGGARRAASAPQLDPLCLSACPGDRLPVWSADGKRIAFLDFGGPTLRGDRTAKIRVVDADGRNLRTVPLPAGSGAPWTVAWSPDGEMLAVTTYLGVHVVRADSGALVGESRPTPSTASGNDTSPAWSPDGRRLAFLRERCCSAGSFAELRVMDPDGGNQVSLAGAEGSGAMITSAAYSPSGRLAYVRGHTDADGNPLAANAELVVANADGSSPQTVFVARDLDSLSGPVQWSADGTRVAAHATQGSHRYLVLVDPATGQSQAPLAWRDASLSPDFARVASVRDDAEGTPQLVVQSRPGVLDVRVVGAGTPPEARALLQFSWAPDGKRLAYVTDGECPTVLAVHVVGVDGANRDRLDHPCRIAGTAHADRLFGTARPDGLLGFGGNDTIFAGAGPDFVQGGAGADRIAGQSGNDRLAGGPGRDRVEGGPGRDRIAVRDGERDSVTCGPGADSVTADRLDTIAPDCERVTRR